MFLDVKDRVFLFYLFLIIVIATLTYASYYYMPAAAFWDENYHIASAQKYIEGVMFMEPHPPLGKLLIAFGEWALDPNTYINISHYAATDYIKDFPKGYSFAGVRLMPVIFSVLSAVLFFLILFRISKRAQISFLFSSFYLFSNAFILHSRAAMLESIQIFFIFLSLFYFLILLDRKQKGWKEYLILGLFIGLAVAVKLNSLILTLLFPFLFFYNFGSSLGMAFHLKKFIAYGISMLTGILIIWIGVFYIHFSLGSKMGVNSYKASAEYKVIIEKGENTNILNFTVMMRDNLKYMAGYAQGVPRYDACKKGENGSLAITWPVGNKSINYSWNKKDGKVSYRYLQANPIIWFSVLFGMILATSLIIGRVVFAIQIKDHRLFYIILTLSAMYYSYMIVMINIARVLYLYHYFVPLFFGAFVFFTIYCYIFKEELEENDLIIKVATFLFVAVVIYVFYFFSPFTYFEPLDVIEFMERNWFDFWKLEPVL